MLEQRLVELKSFLGVDPNISWNGTFYQYANRLTHLYFLREVNGQDAYLAFVYFTGDPMFSKVVRHRSWKAALTLTKCAHAVTTRHRLSRYVAEVFIDVADMEHAA